MCIIKLGNIVEGILQVLTFGNSKEIASWIATKLGYEDCGCEERRIWLNELTCKKQRGIKL